MYWGTRLLVVATLALPSQPFSPSTRLAVPCRTVLPLAPRVAPLLSVPDEDDVNQLEELLASQQRDEEEISRLNSGPREYRRPARPRRTREEPQSKLALQDENVPEAQQPAQELADLKVAPVFGWGQLEDDEFSALIGRTYGILLLFPSLPIALVTYPIQTQPLQALLAANLGAVAITSILLIRLWVGWSYVGDRLRKDVGYYEESGWYDGFLSVKPENIRRRDQLLFEFEVLPVLTRLSKFGAGTAAMCLVSFAAFRFAAPEDPYAMYDPEYLAQLQMDDEAAAKEQQRRIEQTRGPFSG
eukprot:CAMPEP_0118983420 /NCGR_PEP_ID=MMETSP1173-20130426/35315_1 /TAXON_ID=1034831 /ORGANISM="Rhizochromulina marina cf, Strain CCMP1243" /LENGTH=300 /DNA_ID=CAMNT_0006933993 /DNA_START=89 /DNA_END=988 /DNA_ORIENTATION=+